MAKGNHSIIAKGPYPISEDQYHELNEQSMGLCRMCGVTVESCEPDTRKRRCPACQHHEVYGLEELMIREELDIG